jgi:PAS domain S-box-containing protein
MTDHSNIAADHYRLILDSLSEGVCTVDRRWNITSFNQAAQELTGVSGEESQRMRFGDIFSCDICECQFLLSGVMDSGEPIHDVNTVIVNRKGRRIPLSLNAAPFRNEAGEIEGLVAIFRDDRSIEVLRKELRHGFTFEDIVSKNNQVLRILDILPNVAESDCSVLILGPSGTGKELLARAVHNTGPRRDKPFVAVNCGALPDNLLESELFGYKRGAFTGAVQDKPGRLAMAEGGTLLLDEIGDISPAMQVKLLRVLQERQYEPLGGTATLKANVRFLAATNQDLKELVKSKQFRSDLYYRLNVIEFFLPPLADRPEDIPLLLEHFLERLNAEKGRKVKSISRKAMERLVRYEYPGNIRELQNIVERAYILCPRDEIQEQCLPAELLGGSPATRKAARAPEFLNLRSMSREESRDAILAALRECDGRRKETAARLGINPSTLWRRMKALGIN